MIRRWLRAARPSETRFFLFLGGFGFVLAAIYWVLTYELAGTVLLAGFGLGAFLVGLVLLLDKRGRGLPADAGTGSEAGVEADRGSRADTRAGVDPDDTPFTDERGRLPQETLAPLALGLGVALSLTAVVFGPWLVVAGIVPLGWGAWAWLSGARDELDAMAARDLSAAQSVRRTTRATSDEG